jgi:hypothetical protein
LKMRKEEERMKKEKEWIEKTRFSGKLNSNKTNTLNRYKSNDGKYNKNFRFRGSSIENCIS